MIADNKRWYVLWIGSGKKNKLLDYLKCNTSVQVWDPQFKQEVVNQDVQSIPIFDDYCFALCSESDIMVVEDCFKEVCRAACFLAEADHHRPISLTDEEVENLKALEVTKVSTEDFKKDDVVVITSGPLQDFRTVVLDVKTRSLLISIKLFQREQELWIRKESCQKV